MSFMNALSIAKLYDGMPEPNNLIDEAEEMAASDIDALEKSVMKLKEWQPPGRNRHQQNL